MKGHREMYQDRPVVALVLREVARPPTQLAQEPAGLARKVLVAGGPGGIAAMPGKRV
jgi:hypothetical protein